MIIFPILASILSIAYAFLLAYWVKKYPTGSGKQVEIWTAIRDGSRAYLKRQNYTVAVVAIIIAIILWESVESSEDCRRDFLGIKIEVYKTTIL